MKEKKTICYHGTDKQTASKILLEGFEIGTHFARHLEDAIEFGGDHIFEVSFKQKTLPKNWQFVTTPCTCLAL